MYLDTSKSWKEASRFSIMQPRGWDIILSLDWDLPTPEAATFIQKGFMQDSLVKKCPIVFGPQSEEINGRRTPICNYEHPAEYRAYYSEEDALVYRDLQRSGLQEDMPEEDREGQIDRSARPPIDPPTYEEALHSLGRAPTAADLGPRSPGSCSSSLVPYEAGEDSNPEKD